MAGLALHFRNHHRTKAHLGRAITELEVKVQRDALSLVRIDQEHAVKTVVKHGF